MSGIWTVFTFWARGLMQRREIPSGIALHDDFQKASKGGKLMKAYGGWAQPLTVTRAALGALALLLELHAGQ